MKRRSCRSGRPGRLLTAPKPICRHAAEINCCKGFPLRKLGKFRIASGVAVVLRVQSSNAFTNALTGQNEKETRDEAYSCGAVFHWIPAERQRRDGQHDWTV